MGLASIYFLLVISIGCSDDTVAPSNKSQLEKLTGDWEVKIMVVDTLVLDISDNNIHWYFSESGEFCTLYRTAYGYVSGNSGQVSTNGQFLTEEFRDERATWRLSLSSGADSLHAYLVEPDTHDIDSWFLERVDDAPEATCFSGGLK